MLRLVNKKHTASDDPSRATEIKDRLGEEVVAAINEDQTICLSAEHQHASVIDKSEPGDGSVTPIGFDQKPRLVVNPVECRSDDRQPSGSWRRRMGPAKARLRARNVSRHSRL